MNSFSCEALLVQLKKAAKSDESCEFTYTENEEFNSKNGDITG